MSGKRRYERAIGSLAERKESKSIYFSGQLGITTNGEAQVEVPGRNGFVWVRLRNQLNEVIQAFNESVSLVYDLPVLVEWDKRSPTRYKIVSRDVGRYSDWGSSSSYLPVHGAQHSFNTLTGIGGGDVVWVYSQQFMPLLITPSGSAGSMSVSAQPAPYYYDEQFRWAGGTGISGFSDMLPTGSSNARMILIYLDPDSGNILTATGSMTEFANTITGTAQILPYVPALIEPTDVPLAGVRLITGTSKLLWTNVYDLRDYLVHSSVSGSSGGVGNGAPDDAQYVTMALDGDLSDERVLTAGADIDVTDGGAGGNATVSVETGTFSRPGHTHTEGAGGFPAIYDDSVFVATGVALSFGSGLDVSNTGTSVFIDSTGASSPVVASYLITGSTQSIPDNSDTYVNFNQEVYDTNNALTTGSFTASSNGYYYVDAHIQIALAAWAASERVICKLYKEGSQYSVLQRQDAWSNQTLIMTFGGSDIVYLNGGEKIDIRVNQNSGASVDLSNNQNGCRLNIHKV